MLVLGGFKRGKVAPLARVQVHSGLIRRGRRRTPNSPSQPSSDDLSLKRSREEIDILCSHVAMITPCALSQTRSTGRRMAHRGGCDGARHGSGPCSRTTNTVLLSPREIVTCPPVIVYPVRPIHTAVFSAISRIRGLREAPRGSCEGGNECAQ